MQQEQPACLQVGDGRQCFEQGLVFGIDGGQFCLEVVLVAQMESQDVPALLRSRQGGVP